MHYEISWSRERYDHACRCGGMKLCRSKAELTALATELGIRHEFHDAAKWRECAAVDDMKTGSTKPRWTVLTEA